MGTSVKRHNGNVHRAAANILQAEKAARPAAPCATYCYVPIPIELRIRTHSFSLSVGFEFDDHCCSAASSHDTESCRCP